MPPPASYKKNAVRRYSYGKLLGCITSVTTKVRGGTHVLPQKEVIDLCYPCLHYGKLTTVVTSVTTMVGYRLSLPRKLSTSAVVTTSKRSMYFKLWLLAFISATNEFNEAKVSFSISETSH